MNRIQHFRASFLLVLSSAILFWVISYWLPLPAYLTAIASDNYAEYRSLIQVMVVIYLVFTLLNLVIAGLVASRISQALKFWLALIPAAVLLLTPFVLTIPIAIKYPNQNYFVLFQAFFRLFRFTKPDTFALALVVTFLAVALNVFAAILVRRSKQVDKVPANLKTRYGVYSGIVALACAILVAVFAFNSNIRAQDRQSCYDYRALEVPVLDDEVPTFLNELTLYSQQAGSSQLKVAFGNFTTLSRELFQAMGAEIDDATLAQYQTLVAASKLHLEELCSEFKTD